MPEPRFCHKCGLGLNGKVESELSDGTKYGRCSRCQRPYVVSVGKKVKAQTPEVESKSEPTEE